MNTHTRLSKILFMGVIFSILSSLVVPSGWVGARPEQAFGSISFVPNIETAGIVVSGAGLPATAQLFYRRVGDVT